MTSSGVDIKQRIGPWLVTLSWDENAGPGGPSRVVIEPAPDADPADVAAGVSQTVVRQVDFAGATHERFARGVRVSDGSVQRQQSLRRAAQQRGITDRYLALLGAVYVDLVNRGERGVTARLADITGKAQETIKIHLKQARQDELLTSMSHRAGGELTVKARELLR